ncbi:hypothetical protein FRX31_028207 [Thalictrum thalictroides]|uniref:Uncharacterized protein n=1 Tax=Thalictrum thalictroides TaxID=46969 RepID=A0A7J6VAT6_THATH|nr:hypothetical protein FRX31_028207 [Thalictrum thalictroides]
MTPPKTESFKNNNAPFNLPNLDRVETSSISPGMCTTEAQYLPDEMAFHSWPFGIGLPSRTGCPSSRTGRPGRTGCPPRTG